MSGRASVEKGKRGEREIVRQLQVIADRVVQELNAEREGLGQNALETVRLLRNSLQSAIGGHDILGIDWIFIEVKYQETTFLTNWWNQCLQNTPAGKIPVLIHRKNNQTWLVRMVGNLPLFDGRHVATPVDISFAAFLIWFEHELKSRCR